MAHQNREAEAVVPHVLIFPLPIQSSVNSMLKLAELLCLTGIHVTFLNTKHNQRRLLRYSNIESRFGQYPGFHFQAIADGLAEDHPRTVEQFTEILDSLQSVAEPFLREILGSSGDQSSHARLRITCVIAEGLYSYAMDVANEMRTPFVVFETISPCCLWTYLCIPKLIEAGELPFPGNDLDAMVTSITGTESFLRRRDLPHFLRGDYMTDRNGELAMAETEQVRRAAGLILNSFEALDGPFLSHIRSQAPNLYAIGPLQLHLKTRIAATTATLPTLSNSLWDEDRSCISWLDAQPSKSVIYVSFGSLIILTNEEFSEFWHGLINSQQRFLWIIRPDSIKRHNLEHHQFLKELTRDAKDKGLILSWVPQEEVLSHPAIGGFLTHSGWNSTLESVIAGVPMICWPRYVDQQVTSRFVTEVWKFGLDMKDLCDRTIIEKMIRDFIGRKDEFSQAAERMSKLAEESVAEGGSSHSNLDRLVQDIRRFSGEQNLKFQDS